MNAESQRIEERKMNSGSSPNEKRDVERKRSGFRAYILSAGRFR
jgi:hypothetical protein